MDAISPQCKSHIGAGIDQKSSSQFSVLSSQFPQDCDGLASQRLQGARGKVFFTELNVIDAGSGSLTDFLQQVSSARKFVDGEGSSVGDVVKKAALSHERSAISGADESCRLMTSVLLPLVLPFSASALAARRGLGTREPSPRWRNAPHGSGSCPNRISRSRIGEYISSAAPPTRVALLYGLVLAISGNTWFLFLGAAPPR